MRSPILMDPSPERMLRREIVIECFTRTYIFFSTPIKTLGTYLGGTLICCAQNCVELLFVFRPFRMP